MDTAQFLNDAKSFEEIFTKIAELSIDPCEAAINDLSGFLLVKDRHTFGKFCVPALACRAFLNRGPDGIRIMASLLRKAEGMILPSTIVECLWYASHGQLASIRDVNPSIVPPSLQAAPTPEVAAAARLAFQELVLLAQHNQDIFEVLLHFMYTDRLSSLLGPLSSDALKREVFRIVTESSIKITKQLLDDYELLLSSRVNEEAYQQFLSRNPVLLDPLANRVIPKQPLGLEFKTDYVIQRLDDQYFAVEIEKPQDSLFTRADDFTADFTHAFGQVIDFLEWVDTHPEYARHHLPGISSPRGMLVMGMRADLSVSQSAKLKRLCINLPNIEVLTFDDLLQRGRTLYNNIRKSTEGLE